MNYITTTELRTKTPQLVNALKNGVSVRLIHRSKVVGEFKPLDENRPIFSIKEFKKLLKEIGPLPYLSYKERDRRYRAEMERKHGKGVLRH